MRKIFIIDDSKQIRERLIKLLVEIPNVQVIGESASAQGVLEAIDTLRPDVLVLDIRLPGQTGIELLRDVKQHQPDLQVFIMTSYDYPEYRRQSIRAGADMFFNKTKEFEALIEALKNNECQRRNGDAFIDRSKAVHRKEDRHEKYI